MEKDFKVTGATTKTEEETRLTEHAFRILESKLKAYGSAPGDSQLEALRWLLSAYSQMSHGQLTGRFAFPFPCGTGKTQSIVAFAQALAELEEKTDCQKHISMAISASKVEALCDLKRDLIGSGVPEQRLCTRRRIGSTF